MNELRHRGVEDILLAVVDGLKGFPDAIRAVFPEAMVQTCIVHLLRHSLDFVSWKDRKLVAAALKDIYRAIDAAAGEAALAAFEGGPWGRRYPAIAQSWRRAWTEVVPFYAFPADVRRILYTTNAIEALNAKLRRAVRARGHFPTDEAAMKLLFLLLNRAEKEWRMGPRDGGWPRLSSPSSSASASPGPWQPDLQPADHTRNFRQSRPRRLIGVTLGLRLGASGAQKVHPIGSTRPRSREIKEPGAAPGRLTHRYGPCSPASGGLLALGARLAGLAPWPQDQTALPLEPVTAAPEKGRTAGPLPRPDRIGAEQPGAEFKGKADPEAVSLGPG
jgi:hypothetical protein